MAAENIKF